MGRLHQFVFSQEQKGNVVIIYKKKKMGRSHPLKAPLLYLAKLNYKKKQESSLR